MQNLLSAGKRARFRPADFRLEKLQHDPPIRLLPVPPIAVLGESRCGITGFLEGREVAGRESRLQK